MIFAATPPWDETLARCYFNAADFCYKVPDAMTLEEAAMVEPVAVACAIAKMADLLAHQTILVLGCGPIGVLCQAAAKAYNARTVVGVDVVQSKLDVAGSYGVDHTFLPPRAEPGVDPVEHAEKVAAMMNEQLGGATDVQAGMGKENVLVPITTVCTRGLTVNGSIRYLPGCYPAAIDLISRGQVDVGRLITNRYAFEKVEQAFELVKAGKQDVFKVMIGGVQ